LTVFLFILGYTFIASLLFLIFGIFRNFFETYTSFSEIDTLKTLCFVFPVVLIMLPFSFLICALSKLSDILEDKFDDWKKGRKNKCSQ